MINMLVVKLCSSVFNNNSALGTANAESASSKVRGNAPSWVIVLLHPIGATGEAAALEHCCAEFPHPH